MFINLDVTVDPALAPPEIVQPEIVRGKEPSVILKRVHEWLESFRQHKDLNLKVLGIDLDGRSRLICRFLRPQKPPAHIEPSDPFAIEACARYVSLIPFIADIDLFPKLNDLWCTDQEFLSMRCGDWEEHASLLCNYFNYVDTFRLSLAGYSEVNIKSFMVKCDTAPEGDVWMVMRRDCTTGHCEFWDAIRGDCFFVPCRQSTGLLDRLCPIRSKSAAAQEELRALQPTPSNPIRRIHMACNADNAWANLQRPSQRDVENHSAGVAVMSQLSFDFQDASCWSPLFRGGRDELDRLSSSGAQVVSAGKRPMTAASGARENPLFLEPSEALNYEAADPHQAAKVTHRLESLIEHEILSHRATGDKSGVQQLTRFNHVISERLGELLDDLERLSLCHRRSGSEAVFPLRSNAASPASLKAINDKLQRLASDFRTGRPGTCVFGVPFNHCYTQVLDKLVEKQIWEIVRDSHLLELGSDSAEYAVKVRVYPYACQIMSVWVFVACAISPH